MNVNIFLEGKSEVEYFTSIFTLGLLTAIEEKAIELEKAEQYIFNPLTLDKLNECELDGLLTEIIHLGTELEDVKSLIPDKYYDNIKDIKSRVIEILKSEEYINISGKKLLKNLVND